MSIPAIFEKHEGSNLMWDIYSRQLKDRIIWLGADVNSHTANAIVAQLLYLDTLDKDKDIHLYINSPGGVITSGMAIFDTMNYVAADVSTICIGQAASMGAFLLGAGAKGKRFILPSAEVMIHQPSGGASGQASDIAITAKHILTMRTRLNNLMAEHTGQLVDKIAADTERDHFMSAQEALEYGIVDKIVTKRDRSLYEDQEE